MSCQSNLWVRLLVQKISNEVHVCICQSQLILNILGAFDSINPVFDGTL